MSDFVSPLLQWLNANPEWAGIATFLISAAESVAIIGTILPGSVTMTAIGALAGAGIIPLWSTLFWAMAGAIVGDGISYWIGHYFNEKIRAMWPFRDNPSVLEKGEIFVHKYGVMSVFIGRFVGPVRALVPLVAGMLGMKPLQFTIANITSAIGWAPAYMLPGILLGAASLELPPDIALHVILVLLFMFLFCLLCIWALYKFFQLIQHQTTQFQNWIWRKLKKSRYFSSITFVLKHHNHKKTHGQLSRALLFITTLFVFAMLVLYVKATGAEYIAINDIMFHLFRGIRTETFDNVMLPMTLLGQKQVLFVMGAVLFAWLLLTKRIRAACHLLLVCVLASGSVFILKHLIQSPRPWGIMQSPESFSMPSGHTTLSTALYMGIAFFMAAGLRRMQRRFIYMLALLLILVISCSRLYLGAHWFTDILAGWLLGAIVVIFTMISFDRKTERPAQSYSLFLIALISLCMATSLFHYRSGSIMKQQYAQESWPHQIISMEGWWSQNNGIPAYQASLFGFPSQYINLEWVGSIEQIREALLQAGWDKPPARDWVSTLHRIADVQSNQFLPMVSLQYLDKKPVLILTRKMKDKQSLIVIRIWNAHRSVREAKESLPLWVGIISEVPRSYSWLYNRSNNSILLDTALVLGKNKHWESKNISVDLQQNKKVSTGKNILIIRKHQH